MKAFAYARPRTLPQVTQILSPARRPKGGGFDLLDLAKRGVATPEAFVDLASLEGAEGEAFRAITAKQGGGFVLGAGATLAQIASSPLLLQGCPALSDAAAEAATPQVRNAATLAGNLLQRPRCAYFRDPHFDCLRRGGTTCPAMDGVHEEMAVLGNARCCAVHASNLATVLVALDAEAVAFTGAKAPGDRVTHKLASGFFLRPEDDPAGRDTILDPRHLLIEVSVQGAPASAYVEVNHKQSFDWAAAACAVVLRVSGGKVEEARVVLGAVAPVPWRCPGAEAALKGHAPGDAAAIAAAAEASIVGATPLRDNAHKVRLIRAVVRRAAEAAAARSKGR